ncbi:MAG TPA: SemiSWEET transporter [Flavipsychrobacter sp.]|nr:SemiSWEET transporter [Flavipsychrobacter sp.]
MQVSGEFSLFVGAVAAFCTTISFVPQVIKTIKTNDTSSISLGMYSLFILGTIAWAGYGLLIKNVPVIFANLVTLLLACIILSYKIKHLTSHTK